VLRSIYTFTFKNRCNKTEDNTYALFSLLCQTDIPYYRWEGRQIWIERQIKFCSTKETDKNTERLLVPFVLLQRIHYLVRAISMS